MPTGFSAGSGRARASSPRYATRRSASSTASRRSFEAAVADKRLLILEPEFRSILVVAERDNSILSSLLRNAWDGTRLQNRTTGRGKVVATDAHIGVLASITQDELRLRLSADSRSNGFANRFLHVAVYRSASIPDPPPIPLELRASHVTALAQARAAAVGAAGAVERSPDAAARWVEAYRAELSVDRPGRVGAMLDRAEAHVLRLSLIYALSESSSTIELRHVEAALSLWRYCEASARLIYGRTTGVPAADRLLEALYRAGRAGLSREAIGDRVFSKHGGTDAALRPLLEQSLAVEQIVPTAGRPRTIYVHVDHAPPEGKAG